MTSCQEMVTSFSLFFIDGQFGTIWKPESGRMVCSTYMLINSNLELPENGTENI